MEKDYLNETSNTIAGINTPPDRQDCAATDMLNDFVEKTMDNIQHTFEGDSVEK
ncbi:MULTISPECIES: hypothetical protein [unclassified Paenibacillus]|uniref:hypothetical protein n=1 Tax=unclassified Paenibacillus TaxID=185978 RepID=UPI001AE7302B|nr:MULTISPECIES: hypothetical protein [unclassified Paenibacillus]MBP1156066.1 hypothetical protein [Paenibacillus sp. PvP091]MBP1168548.1 hypothetical protein [Paenibacillus sp. PvR098]MBP2439576.1 hypothetical protein [Paenibacillus sp. PvP052]